MSASPIRCTHGHLWKPYGDPCPACEAMRGQPHAAEVADVQLGPSKSIKYRVCLACFQAATEPIHRLA